MKYVISEQELKKYLEKWSEEYHLFVPGKNGEFFLYKTDLDINWNIVPVWGSVKEFVFPPRYQVVGPAEETAPQEKPVILMGVRNCDLRALIGIYDKIFLEEEPADPVYKSFREKLKIVTVDCTDPADTCFCMAVGGNPFNKTRNNFALNLTFLDNEIIITSGKEADESLIDYDQLSRVSQGELNQKKDLKKTAELRVKNNFKRDYKKDKFGAKIKNSNDQEYWKDKKDRCMQCGGCNFCCPTCYCNVLNELSDKRKFQKILQWDSCQFPGYARVGGGGNPREKLWERFRHRYYCKFTLMLEEFEIPGCTGCGRCIQTCPAEIDIKDTVEGLF